MNYLELIVGFHRWKEVNPLPASAIALWYELVAVCNKAGWPEEFTISNGLLQATTSLSRKEFDRARQLLIEFGLIHYKKSNRVNNSGKYTIISRLFKRDNERGNERDNERGTLKDLKDLNINQNKKPRAEFVKMTDDEYDRLVQRYGQEDAVGMIEMLSNYKGSRGKKYKSDYHAVLKWVAEEYLKRKTPPAQSKNDLALQYLREAEERERSGSYQDFDRPPEHLQQLLV